jgi:hypothetical protein
VRSTLKVWLTIAALLLGFSAGLVFGPSAAALAKADETVINVEVSSAEHELQEGYFALGEQGTVLAKPGSDLYMFLSRQRGQKVKIVLSKPDSRELARLPR